MREKRKKIVFISGPITGVDEYREAFEAAEDDLSALGYIPLNPARLPEGMSEAAYMRICLAMIDSADAVLALPGSLDSVGANIEQTYSRKTGKPVVPLMADERQTWLSYDLKEVLGG